MDDAVRVCERHGLTDSLDDPQPFGETGRGQLVERSAAHELHRVEHAAIHQRAHVVDRHDPGMLEPGQRARFTQ